MSDLKSAILDAKYIDMIDLADFVVQDCGLPDFDGDGIPLPQQNEVAAAIFRWAAMRGKPADDAQQTDTGNPPMDNMEQPSSSQTVSGPSNWPNTGDMPNQTAQGDN